MNKFLTKGKALALAAPAALMALGGNVYAAVPTEVSAELATAKTDGVSVATLVLVAVIAVFAFKFMRKGL